MNALPPPDMNQPAPWDNLRVGLLGGTFDPPHAGHVHISKAAQDWLKLDAIWWLITPQNPLKKSAPSASLKARLQMAQDITKTEPDIIVSDLEAKMETLTSFDTICALKQHFPKVEFVWITGMDNATSLHKWYKWEDLLAQICTAHLPRGNEGSEIPSCPLKSQQNQTHIVPKTPDKLPLMPLTSYWLMHEETIDVSSSKIRDNG